MNNCVFNSITSLDQPAAVVQVVLSHYNKVISFNNCTFKDNYAKLVVSIQISKNMDFACRVILVNQTATFSSRLFFRKGQLISNKGQILLVKGIRNKKLNISMIGPIKIESNWSGIDVFNDLIVFENVVVYIHGPVTISHNYARSFGILLSVKSEVLFHGHITFKGNQCYQIIFVLDYACIKVMEYTNIEFIYNKCSNKLIEIRKDRNNLSFSIHNIQ